ncbi:MAG: hypothetical protein WKF84_20310 [Pyrinomonadaceae bacterium]
MEDGFSIQKLLTLRKVTRAVSDTLRAQMKEHLTTLAPLLRPKAVLGDYIQSSAKESARGGEKLSANCRVCMKRSHRQSPST